MKKLVVVFSVMLLTLIFKNSAAAQAASVAGEWDVTLNFPGQPATLQAHFKVDGDKLTGEMKASKDPEPKPIQGTINGKDIKFTITVYIGSDPRTITLTGQVDGDTIKGTADIGGSFQTGWSAKRAPASVSTSSSSTAPTGTTAGEKIDLTGSWNFQIETRAGTGNPTFTFKQEGEKLTGKHKGRRGESDLTGTVKGNQVEFSFKVTGQVEGNMTYTGTTDGKTMKGKVGLAGGGEGTFTGKKQL